LRLENLAKGKYTIEIRNFGSDAEESDYTITTYANEPVPFLDRESLLQEEINKAKRKDVFKKYAENKQVKGEAYLDEDTGYLSVRVTNGAGKDLKVTIGVKCEDAFPWSTVANVDW